MTSKVSSIDDLGPRIIVLGPSNSGKSTLADAIARASNRDAVHLDLFRHLPNTDWVARSDEEFFALHDEAIKAPFWVMDGNYSNCFPQRAARATGVILIETSTLICLWRYFRRTLFEKNRIGGLGGSKDSVKWEMIKWIAISSPRSRKALKKRYEELGLPKIFLPSSKELNNFYSSMNLTRV